MVTGCSYDGVLEIVNYDLFNQQKRNSSDTEEVPTEKHFTYPQQKETNLC